MIFSIFKVAFLRQKNLGVSAVVSIRPKSTELLNQRLLAMTYGKVGMEGVEPSRLATHDPKSCLSASSSTSPRRLFGGRNYTVRYATCGKIVIVESG